MTESKISKVKVSHTDITVHVTNIYTFLIDYYKSTMSNVYDPVLFV